MVNKVFKCPECGYEFSDSLIGKCPKCSYKDKALFKWINPEYRPKRGV